MKKLHVYADFDWLKEPQLIVVKKKGIYNISELANQLASSFVLNCQAFLYSCNHIFFIQPIIK